MKRISGFILIMLLIPCLAFADLTVYFLDVGQGDSALIVCDGEAMIIDGGLPGQSSKIFSFLEKNLHVNHLKYMVATHPDNDHIGGLPAVFQRTKVQYFYSPVNEFNSNLFGKLLNAAKEQKTKIQVPYDQDSVFLGGATVTFYNSGREKKIVSVFRRDEPEEIPENNDMSLVVRIVYREVTFLFTGDIEAVAENRLLDSGVELKADVLKVAHHGSKGSSTIDFLDKVNPKYAVISCGKNNGFKHPSGETLRTLLDRGIDLFRTDLQGDIICKTDGKTIEFKTDKETTTVELFKAPQ